MSNTPPPAQPHRPSAPPPRVPVGATHYGRHPYGTPGYPTGPAPYYPGPYGTAPAAPTLPRPAPPVKTGPRVGMIITGIVIALLGVWIIAASCGFVVDEQLALILILALGGVTLIVSALIAAFRRPKA